MPFRFSCVYRIPQTPFFVKFFCLKIGVSRLYRVKITAKAREFASDRARGSPTVPKNFVSFGCQVFASRHTHKTGAASCTDAVRLDTIPLCVCSVIFGWVRPLGNLFKGACRAFMKGIARNYDTKTVLCSIFTISACHRRDHGMPDGRYRSQRKGV